MSIISKFFLNGLLQFQGAPSGQRWDHLSTSKDNSCKWLKLNKYVWRHKFIIIEKIHWKPLGDRSETVHFMFWKLVNEGNELIKKKVWKMSCAPCHVLTEIQILACYLRGVLGSIFFLMKWSLPHAFLLHCLLPPPAPRGSTAATFLPHCLQLILDTACKLLSPKHNIGTSQLHLEDFN